jgi:segregation and condensation protein B
MSIDTQHLRMAEALLFAAIEPLDEESLTVRLPEGADVPAILDELARAYEDRGVRLAKMAGRWAFTTAPDLAYMLEEHRQVTRRLSRAALETLAIVAYHQPVTRAEIEQTRGVSLSQGTLDLLMETGWVRMRGRRRSPGRPLTYGTTDEFLIHFGLGGIEDLPGLAELKSAGLLELDAPAAGLALPGEPLSGDTEEDPVEPGEEESDSIYPSGVADDQREPAPASMSPKSDTHSG